MLTTSWAIALLAFGLAVVLFAGRVRQLRALPLPADRAAPKGDPRAGVLYAFTLGMAPWAKESTRRHMAAYLRGIAFHVAIFLALAALLASPWIGRLPLTARLALAAVTLIGAVCGLIGFAARFVDRYLKAISHPDDYFAVLLVSLFLLAATAALLDPAGRSAFHLTGAVMLIYAPFGKLRHCIYFAFSRIFFGRFVGRRGVLPHREETLHATSLRRHGAG